MSPFSFVADGVTFRLVLIAANLFLLSDGLNWASSHSEAPFIRVVDTLSNGLAEARFIQATEPAPDSIGLLAINLKGQASLYRKDLETSELTETRVEALDYFSYVTRAYETPNGVVVAGIESGNKAYAVCVMQDGTVDKKFVADNAFSIDIYGTQTMEGGWSFGGVYYDAVEFTQRFFSFAVSGSGELGEIEISEIIVTNSALGNPIGVDQNVAAWDGQNLYVFGDIRGATTREDSYVILLRFPKVLSSGRPATFSTLLSRMAVLSSFPVKKTKRIWSNCSRITRVF